MNADIRQFLGSYGSMIDAYRAKVKSGSAALKECLDVLKKMETLGESCTDIGAYMTKITEAGYLNEMTVKISALATEAFAADKAAGTAKKPEVSDLAAGYHRSWESVKDRENRPETKAVYERVFALEKESSSAAEFLRKMAEEGLLLKLAATPMKEEAQKLIAPAEDLSLPSMAYYHETVIELAERTSSVIELETEAERLALENRMEVICDTMILNDLLYTLGNAISSYILAHTEDNKKRVEACWCFVTEFYGLTVEQYFAIPRFRDAIEKVIVGSLNRENPGKKQTPEGFIDECKQVIAACVEKPVSPGPASRASVTLWNKTIPLNELHAFLRHPDRGHSRTDER